MALALVLLLISIIPLIDGHGYYYLSGPRLACRASTIEYSYASHSNIGPFAWSRLSSCCGGHWQSPINFRTDKVICDLNIRAPRYRSHPSGQVPMGLYNDGHFATMTLKTKKPVLTGIPFMGVSSYVLEKIHIHVGNTQGQGSEHTIDYKAEEGEIHLVHYKKEYGSVNAAMNKKDGLVVIAVFIRAQRFPEVANRALNKLVSDVSRLNGINNKITTKIDPRDLLPWDRDFFTYHGSLSTPPCTESVRWVVMRQPIDLTLDDMETLRRMPTKEGEILAKYTNCRPRQPRYGRSVYRPYLPFVDLF